jgi:hypothetical protein
MMIAIVTAPQEHEASVSTSEPFEGFPLFSIFRKSASLHGFLTPPAIYQLFDAG